MKHTYVILCAFFCLFMTTHLVQAQGKAYDKVYYTTKLNSQVIQLIYADGYLAGSTVRIFQGKNDRLLLPQSGAPDDNGDLKFVPEKAATPWLIIYCLKTSTNSPKFR